MSEAGAPLPDEGPQAELERLRRAGAWRFDPVRFHYLQALAKRLPEQPEGVRRLLQHKLAMAVAEYARRFADRVPPPGAEELRVKTRPAARVSPMPVGSPLAQLNEYIRGLAARGRDGDVDGEHEPAPMQAPPLRDELASVRRFRRAWSSGRAQDQVAQAAARRPAHAGPLNSHALVLQSLDLMGELSPDYLRRFLSQVETLQWLDQVREGQAKPAGKAAVAGKTAKRGRKKASG